MNGPLCPACAPGLAALFDPLPSTRACAGCSAIGAAVLPLDAEGRVAEPALTALRAWCRRYLDEWRYNPELGGTDRPARLLARDPRLFARTPDGLEAALASVFALRPGSPVALFQAERPDSTEPFHAIESAQAPELDRYVLRLQRENAFELAEPFGQRVDVLVPHIERPIAVGSTFYRARLGIAQRYARRAAGREQMLHYQPFQGRKMTAPPPPQAPAGRANRQGVSVLYLASDVATAVAEIRPHPAHLISVGAFAAERDLRVADFGTLDFRRWWHNDAKLALYHLAVSLDRALSEAVVPEHRHRYTVTQLLAELTRQRGFDGIRFRSAVGSGTNLCIFTPSLFAARPEEGHVLRVEALHYRFAELPTLVEPGAEDRPLDHEE